MDESAGFLSSPPIMALKGDAHITISKVIRHNYRINLPDNVNELRTKYNYDFVYENEKLIRVDNQIAAQKVQAKKLELFSLVEKDWNQQQESYSPSKRTSFKKYCETHNGFLDIVLPGARQAWFEAQGICKFTDNYIEDAITGQRKMGELIVESINWEKLEKWMWVEINFIKQWMQSKLGSCEGLLGTTLHMDETTPHLHIMMVPLVKKYSKTINADRYSFSNNKIFGNRFNSIDEHHANYLTKSGFEIQPGRKGGKGSYSGVRYNEIATFTKAKHELTMKNLLAKMQLEMTNFAKYQEAFKTYEQWQQEIMEIEKLLNASITYVDKQLLEKWLLILRKMQYYETMLRNEQSLGIKLPEAEKQLSYWRNQMVKMLFIVKPVIEKLKQTKKQNL